jgi:hypothetical protein
LHYTFPNFIMRLISGIYFFNFFYYIYIYIGLHACIGEIFHFNIFVVLLPKFNVCVEGSCLLSGYHVGIYIGLHTCIVIFICMSVFACLSVSMNFVYTSASFFQYYFIHFLLICLTKKTIQILYTIVVKNTFYHIFILIFSKF